MYSYSIDIFLFFKYILYFFEKFLYWTICIIICPQTMFSSFLIQTPSFPIQISIIEKIQAEISHQVSRSQNGKVNIVFVSPEEIQQLNATYRGKDMVTDVLSFHYFDDFTWLLEEEIAGELIFCEEKILSQWQEYWLGSEKEFYKLLIHSFLHILWYDHEADDEYEIMKWLEERIWEKIFEK